MTVIFGLIQDSESHLSSAEIDALFQQQVQSDETYHSIECNPQTLLGVITQNNSPIEQPIPLVSNNERYTIVADVRLDNAEEIYQKLGIDLPSSTYKSAPELILHAYQQWQEDCVNHLLGDFAFAIWDENKSRLFCGRDFIGARPFYYYHAKGIFAFSSDLNILLSLFKDEIVINQEQVLKACLDYGAEYYYDPHETFYTNVFKLPFAHAMVLDHSKVTLNQYWYPSQVERISYETDQQYYDELYQLVDDAITSRIQASSNVGAHISGGLDSSTIAILAAEQLKSTGKQLHTYSWSPPAGNNPLPDTEQYRIEVLREKYNLQHSYVNHVMTLDDLISFSFRQNFEVERGVLEQAHQHGIDMILSGWGGDEFITFNGRGIRADLFVKGRWFQLYKTFNFRKNSHDRKNFFTHIWRDIIGTLLPDNLYDRWFKFDKLKPNYDDRCIRDDVVQKLKQLQKQYEVQRHSVRGRCQTHGYLFGRGYITNRIELWAEFGREYGVTYAYPLLDKRVVEFALSLPDHMHLRQGKSRYTFINTFRGLFSPETIRLIGSKGETIRISHYLVIKSLLINQLKTSDLVYKDNGHSDYVDMSCLNQWLNQDQPYEALEQFRTWRIISLLSELEI